MLSIRDYRTAVDSLSERQKEILKTLYFKAPFQSANEIADVLKYKSFGAANLQIGTIGKAIAKQLDVEPTETYSHTKGEMPSYYTLVHDYFEEGWDLQENLREAIRISLIAKPEDDLIVFPDEIALSDNYKYREGKAAYVLVNRYERNQAARKKCLEVKGNTCFGCSMNFSKEYGDDISNDLVHVHHLKKLGDIKKEEEKDVIDDLVPLCPNCHAVVHSTNPMMTIEKLRERRQRPKRMD